MRRLVDQVTPRELVQQVCDLKLQDTFNPYSDRCEVHDLQDAPARRATALHEMLQKAQVAELDSMWIGRDLGYRGGRRTGLAFTDDVHLKAHAKRWSLSLHRPTKGELVAERTAKIVWRVLRSVDATVFLWNVFPLHPHEPGKPFSNRRHNSRERESGEEILAELVQLLRPGKLLAVGNDAERTAHRIASKEIVRKVQHPSYGGQPTFLKQMAQLYDL